MPHLQDKSDKMVSSTNHGTSGGIVVVLGGDGSGNLSHPTLSSRSSPITVSCVNNDDSSSTINDKDNNNKDEVVVEKNDKPSDETTSSSKVKEMTTSSTEPSASESKESTLTATNKTEVSSSNPESPPTIATESESSSTTTCSPPSNTQVKAKMAFITPSPNNNTAAAASATNGTTMTTPTAGAHHHHQSPGSVGNSMPPTPPAPPNLNRFGYGPVMSIYGNQQIFASPIRVKNKVGSPSVTVSRSDSGGDGKPSVTLTAPVVCPPTPADRGMMPMSRLPQPTNLKYHTPPLPPHYAPWSTPPRALSAGGVTVRRHQILPTGEQDHIHINDSHLKRTLEYSPQSPGEDASVRFQYPHQATKKLKTSLATIGASHSSMDEEATVEEGSVNGFVGKEDSHVHEYESNIASTKGPNGNKKPIISPTSSGEKLDHEDGAPTGLHRSSSTGSGAGATMPPSYPPTSRPYPPMYHQFGASAYPHYPPAPHHHTGAPPSYHHPPPPAPYGAPGAMYGGGGYPPHHPLYAMERHGGPSPPPPSPYYHPPAPGTAMPPQYRGHHHHPALSSPYRAGHPPPPHYPPHHSGSPYHRGPPPHSSIPPHLAAPAGAPLPQATRGGKTTKKSPPARGQEASSSSSKGTVPTTSIKSVAEWQRAARATGKVPSANRCVPLQEPIPSKYWGEAEKTKDAAIPDFHRLVNFPDYLAKPRSNSDSANSGTNNGKRNCVMCGKSRVCSATSLVRGRTVKTSKAADAAGKANASKADPENDDDDDGTSHIIPRQNKGLCTACDVTVWVVMADGLEIKWCKGCKNFRPWAAFGDKGSATKCVRCRDRQREKYAAQKDEIRLRRYMRTSSSDSAGFGDKAPLSDDHHMAAARGLRNLMNAASAAV